MICYLFVIFRIMGKINRREFEENSTANQSFSAITTESSEHHFENFDTNKDTLSTFIKDTEHIVERLKLPNPGFVSPCRKYLKDKQKDIKNEISFNTYVGRGAVLDFKETLDNWSVEDDELRDEMIELSSFCTTILDLIWDDRDVENIQAKKEKKEKKQKYREMKYRGNETDLDNEYDLVD